MQDIITTVYKYDELKPAAQEKAREWFREGSAGGNWWVESVDEDAQTCLRLIGFTIDNIYWSGFSSQGDGACFVGRWEADKVKAGKLQEHAPQDYELHRLARIVEAIAKEFPHASFTVRHVGHYHHEHSTSFDVSIVDENDDEIETEAATKAEKDLIEASRDAMRWIYRQLQRECDYQNSDDTVAENIRANEYNFTEDGKRFG